MERKAFIATAGVATLAACAGRFTPPQTTAQKIAEYDRWFDAAYQQHLGEHILGSDPNVITVRENDLPTGHIARMQAEAEILREAMRKHPGRHIRVGIIAMSGSRGGGTCPTRCVYESGGGCPTICWMICNGQCWEYCQGIGPAC